MKLFGFNYHFKVKEEKTTRNGTRTKAKRGEEET
jgi:hypothetical protein